MVFFVCWLFFFTFSEVLFVYMMEEQKSQYKHKCSGRENNVL